jgi:hypothetical protein
MLHELTRTFIEDRTCARVHARNAEEHLWLEGFGEALDQFEHDRSGLGALADTKDPLFARYRHEHVRSLASRWPRHAVKPRRPDEAHERVHASNPQDRPARPTEDHALTAGYAVREHQLVALHGESLESSTDGELGAPGAGQPDTAISRHPPAWPILGVSLQHDRVIAKLHGWPTAQQSWTVARLAVDHRVAAEKTVGQASECDPIVECEVARYGHFTNV